MKGQIKHPESHFVKVECKSCGNSQVVFDRATTKVKCLVCDAVLVEPGCGKAKVLVEAKKVY